MAADGSVCFHLQSLRLEGLESCSIANQGIACHDPPSCVRKQASQAFPRDPGIGLDRALADVWTFSLEVMGYSIKRAWGTLRPLAVG
jgi:hypothetical protein